ncbi:MAG TPA: GIY-YIG nuclease family protein [Longimicrobium sp.]|nr:GIY-YIG nuclease family protein [Longimicrobium sp.]
MTQSRAELKRRFKEEGRPMGIFAVRNLSTGKMLVGAAQNLPGALNSQRFQLRMGGHRNRALQADWNALGEDGFAFEVLDELERDAGRDAAEELAVLERMWLDRLQPWGERGYNPEPKGRTWMSLFPAM